MIGLMFAVAMSQSAIHAHCSNAFENLVLRSSVLADAGDFLEAAADREAAGNVFQDCLSMQEAPDAGTFPFDGAMAYGIAAGWHQAGDAQGAKRNLDLARNARSVVLVRYPVGSLTADQRSYLQKLDGIIRAGEAGRFATWGGDGVSK